MLWYEAFTLAKTPRVMVLKPQERCYLHCKVNSHNYLMGVWVFCIVSFVVGQCSAPAMMDHILESHPLLDLEVDDLVLPRSVIVSTVEKDSLVAILTDYWYVWYSTCPIWWSDCVDMAIVASCFLCLKLELVIPNETDMLLAQTQVYLMAWNKPIAGAKQVKISFYWSFFLNSCWGCI